jgi:hypothetical protein
MTTATPPRLTVCAFPSSLFDFLQDVLLMGEEHPSDPYYCQLEAETCRVFSEQMGRFALVGESLHMGAAKRLRLVLFSDAYCTTLEYNIRVYCMDDTQDVFKVRGRSLCRDPQHIGGSPLLGPHGPLPRWKELEAPRLLFD